MKPEPETVLVKPGRPGLLCPYPGRGRRMLPPEGARVRLDTWWRCRLAKGDAVLVPDPAPAKGASHKPTREEA